MAKTIKQRTCIVCRKPAAKGSLYRIVRTPEGAVAFDPTGRANGRGAYVCSVACCEKACKTKVIDRALRVELTNEDHQRIGSQMLQALMDQE